MKNDKKKQKLENNEIIIRSCELEINNLDEFEQIANFFQSSSYVFRGLSNHKYEITSKYDRARFNTAKLDATRATPYILQHIKKLVLNFKNILDDATNSYLINDKIKKFLKALNSSTTDISDSEKNLALLCLLQHYGCSTPLVDFTRNINIALYFACSDKINENGCIWVVMPSRLLWSSGHQMVTDTWEESNSRFFSFKDIANLIFLENSNYLHRQIALIDFNQFCINYNLPSFPRIENQEGVFGFGRADDKSFWEQFQSHSIFTAFDTDNKEEIMQILNSQQENPILIAKLILTTEFKRNWWETNKEKYKKYCSVFLFPDQQGIFIETDLQTKFSFSYMDRIISDKRKYKRLLQSIYGKDFTDRILNYNIRIKSENIISTLNKYYRNDQKRCMKCKEYYNRLNIIEKRDFSQRNMDFPAWLGNLDYTLEKGKPYRKNIMIIGESVTSKFKNKKMKSGNNLSNKRINNICFELGTITKDFSESNDPEDLISISVFWAKIQEMFQIHSPEFLNNFYLTDVGKCDCNKNHYMLFTCGMNYLLKEIKFIHPKIILIMGRRAQRLFLSLLSFDSQVKSIKYDNKNLPALSYFKPNMKKPVKGEFSYLKNLENPIHFLCVPHTSSANNKFKDWNQIGDFIRQQYSFNFH
ncbi:hypothetical protein NEF87_000472 [Candidatus Lokiarchaeum ossiferum]|uniref:FRG domain-containing protein n=1 Tax=Candidatus Lokiarchaeum ossiferum TaxID=2951803 RepID=A0ABY6HMS5_9ARCH|nr:hypothetical protein NEF87_000472 [Candidatus Lokiarchaeum sp. B-35]